MKTLIVGSNGFIGSALVIELSRLGYEILGVDRNPSQQYPRNFTYISKDLPSIFENSAFLSDVKNVVYLGGSIRPRDPIANLRATIANEIAETLEFANFCASMGVKKFIFASSGGAIYGAEHFTPADESARTSPINIYGAVKLSLEALLRVVSQKTGMQTVALRIANPYGPGQPVDGRQGFVGTAAHAALTGKKITILGDGEVVRDYVYIPDVIEAFVKAMQRDIDAEFCILNVGSGEGRSLNQILDCIRAETNKVLFVEYVEASDADVPFCVLDIGAARLALDWLPQYSFSRGLRATIAKMKSMF